MSDRRICFALDLVDEASAIEEYERWHAAGAVWPEIIADIHAAGILDMEIWRAGNRLFMVSRVAADYPRDRPSEPREAEWEALMWKFQRAIPHAAPGEKWVEMKRIFSLDEH